MTVSELPRAGAAFRTPAERIIELTQQRNRAEQELEQAQAEVKRLHAQNERWHSFTGTSFAGVPMAQYWADLILWEGLLNEADYSAIIEIGTYQGGLSLYLAAQAREREMEFRTYDVHEPEHKIPGFVGIDVFAEAQAVGEHMARHQPCIVLCDGGNKPRELKTFSHYVTAGSTFVVHDWGTEFLASDIPPNVRMIHERWCRQLGSACRVFKVRDE